jgi:phosphoribosylformylglycinamidine (FGAM) synthase-like enzyme
LADLVRAARGCHDAAVFFGTPFISGKDSLNNEYVGRDGQRHAIPGTLLISSIGIHPDVRKAVSMDLKAAGNCLFLVGNWNAALSASYALRIAGEDFFGQVDALLQVKSLPEEGQRTYAALHDAILEGLVCSAHDLSEGGLAVAAAEMALAGRLGLDLDLTEVNPDPNLAMFAETNGCLLVEVAEKNEPDFMTAFAGMALKRIGIVLEERQFVVQHHNQTFLQLPVEQLVKAFSGKVSDG